MGQQDAGYAASKTGKSNGTPKSRVSLYCPTVQQGTLGRNDLDSGSETYRRLSHSAYRRPLRARMSLLLMVASDPFSFGRTLKGEGPCKLSGQFWAVLGKCLSCAEA